MDREMILDEIVARVKKAAQPEQIVLFGSRARKKGRENSDYDLLVIKNSNEPRYRRSAPLYTLLADLPVEVDILTYTPNEVKEWSKVSQAFITTAMREGKVLYKRAG